MSEKPSYQFKDLIQRKVRHLDETNINIASMTGGPIPAEAKQYFITTNYKLKENIIRTKGFSVQEKGILSLALQLQRIITDEMQALADTGRPIKRPELNEGEEYKYDEAARINLGHLSNTWLIISRMSGKVIAEDAAQFYLTTVYNVNGVEKRNTGFSLQLSGMITLVQMLLEVRLL